MFSFAFSGPPVITDEKLTGPNYLSWSASVESWFKDQGFENHLTKDSSDIPILDQPSWNQIDAQLLWLLWKSIDPKILSMLRSYKTCFTFWKSVKALYFNEIQFMYNLVHNIQNLKQLDMDMSTYLGKVRTIMEEFNMLLPITASVDEQQTQREKFFLALTLLGLKSGLEPVCSQILCRPTLPSMEDVIAHLLRMSSPQVPNIENCVTYSSVLPSYNNDGGDPGGRAPRRNRNPPSRPQCTYCNRIGHTRDRCYSLNGWPPRPTNISRISSIDTKATCSNSSSGQQTHEFLKYKEAKQSHYSIASADQS